MDGGAERRLNIGALLRFLQSEHFRNVQCIFVVGRLYSIQYKSIFGAPDKVRRDMCEEVGPSRLDFQRDEVKIHHIITSTQDCWS